MELTMAAAKKPGLWANIHAKQERIAHGSGEKMRSPGSPGAPTDAALEAASKKSAVKKAAKKRSSRGAAAKKSAPRKTASARR
jgi:hypothetical protein